MGAEMKTNLCVFFKTILYIVSFPSSTFHSAIYWTPWWAIQWEVRDLLGHLKVRVGHIVSNKWWENITLWTSEFTIFLKCAWYLIVECVSSFGTWQVIFIKKNILCQWQEIYRRKGCLLSILLYFARFDKWHLRKNCLHLISTSILWAHQICISFSL